MLSVRGGGEAARFPAGMTASLLELKLCGVSPANPFPRESRSFPTTPSDVCEKRTPIPINSVFHHPCAIGIKRFISSFHGQNDCHGSLYASRFLGDKSSFLWKWFRDTYTVKGAEGNGETPILKAEVPWSAAYGLD